MKIDIKIFFLILLYIFTNQIKEFSITIFFILIHELGHLTAGILIGLRPKKIEMSIAGFCIEFDTYKKNKTTKKLIVDIAGPAINLVIAIIGMVLKSDLIVYSNLLIILINLITIYPLDGGRILKNLLLYKYNFKKVIDIVNTVSNITLIIITILSSLIILYIKNISIIIIIIYLWYINYIENKKKNLIDIAYEKIKENLE